MRYRDEFPTGRQEAMPSLGRRDADAAVGWLRCLYDHDGALFLRGRAAVWLFGLSLVAIFVTNAYDLAAGTSRTLASRGALIVTVIIVVIAILQFAYASSMKKRAVLT